MQNVLSKLTLVTLISGSFAFGAAPFTPEQEAAIDIVVARKLAEKKAADAAPTTAVGKTIKEWLPESVTKFVPVHKGCDLVIDNPGKTFLFANTMYMLMFKNGPKEDTLWEDPAKAFKGIVNTEARDGRSIITQLGRIYDDILIGNVERLKGWNVTLHKVRYEGNPVQFDTRSLKDIDGKVDLFHYKDIPATGLLGHTVTFFLDIAEYAKKITTVFKAVDILTTGKLESTK